MSHAIETSPSGLLSCGGSFIDVQGVNPPCDVRYVSSDESTQMRSPTLTSFSAFGTLRAAGAAKSGEKKSKGYASGSHAALYYKDSRSFFSTLVLRCDTWAVQWGVEKFDGDIVVRQLCSLSAHTVAGLCASGEKSGKTKVFVSSRFDTPLAKKNDNRLWRQYMAKPHVLELKDLDGDIVTVAPAGPSTFAVLSTTGSVVFVTYQAKKSAESSAEEGVTVEKAITKGFHDVSASTQLCVVSAADDSAEAKGRRLVCAYSVGQCVSELRFTGEASQAQRVEFGEAGKVHKIVPCGENRLCVLLEGGKEVGGVQLVSFDFSSQTITPSKVISLPFLPVSSVYNAKRSIHTLICAVNTAENPARTWKESLVQAGFPLAQGPYDQKDVAKALWKPLHDPYKHYAPRTSVERSEVSELYKDLQMLGDSGAATTAANTGMWVPLELFYCLANKENARSEGMCEVAVFSVKTAPFLHTRLIKQWHNATNGLKQVLQARDTTFSLGGSPLVLSWHPRHLRRALRLMNQEELAETFRNAVAATRTSNYAEAATSAVDTALQIVSLSRQLGAVLDVEDIETVAVLLRGSREMGHETLRFASRMSLLLESTLQQRRMNRLLKQRTGTDATGAHADNVTGSSSIHSLGEDFFGVPPDFEAMRTLQTRYTANTWAQPLRERAEHHNCVATAADRYMKETVSSLGAAAGVAQDHAATWAESGKREHGDAGFELFESTLMSTTERI